ncbi:MAG: histidinol-phosphate transaminase [Pseudomonadota bacterium]
MTHALPHIQAMAPYALAQMQAPPGKPRISLAQNESLRGPSPQVHAAVQAALAHPQLYPDPDWTALRTGIGALHDIDPALILCGAGSLDLIGAIARCFCGPGRAMLAPAHAYPFFRSAAQMCGARFGTAPEDALTVSTQALLDAVQPDTAVVCVANPANPTGTRVPNAALRDLRAALSPDILLVIDEAYGEFADHLDTPVFDMASHGNTVVLRSFSKAYGLAGCRLGWGVFPPAIGAQVRKVLNPNNVPATTQAAGCAAVQDQAYMHDTCTQTATLRDHATERLCAAGITVPTSHTNFILIPFGDAAAAARADAALQAQGIFLRAQSGAGLPHALRLTIAKAPALDTALTHLIQCYQEAHP